MWHLSALLFYAKTKQMFTRFVFSEAYREHIRKAKDMNKSKQGSVIDTKIAPFQHRFFERKLLLPVFFMLSLNYCKSVYNQLSYGQVCIGL